MLIESQPKKRQKSIPTCCACHRQACQGFSMGGNEGFGFCAQGARMPTSAEYCLGPAILVVFNASQGAAQRIPGEPGSGAAADPGVLSSIRTNIIDIIVCYHYCDQSYKYTHIETCYSNNYNFISTTNY
jgi:hypothetical protein